MYFHIRSSIWDIESNRCSLPFFNVLYSTYIYARRYNRDTSLQICFFLHTARAKGTWRKFSNPSSLTVKGSALDGEAGRTLETAGPVTPASTPPIFDAVKYTERGPPAFVRYARPRKMGPWRIYVCTFSESFFAAWYSVKAACWTRSSLNSSGCSPYLITTFQNTWEM